MRNSRVFWVSFVALVAVVLLAVVGAIVSQRPAPSAQAQTTPVAGPDGYSGITVSGTGIVTVKPDVVSFNIGVETKAATVTEAQSSNSDKSKAISDALKKAGVKDEDIKTADYSIYPNYEYTPNQPPKLDGYGVRNILAVTIRDVSKAGSILDAAGSAGANQISNISFSLENNADALKQARTAAMADARTKADQLAAAGNAQVGTVIKIVDASQNVSPVPQMADVKAAAPSLAAGSAATTIESGQFKVIVYVQVTYGIK
ncbi:MAG TPA: SIMPL domain-containing protein [Chloroflexia bacterium]|nr:SIMPL domain-containing protein [Chloroflexia bacterium]